MKNLIPQKPRLVDDWRNFLRWWSVQLGAIGAALTSWLLASPDAALYAWALLPDDLKAYMPPQYMPFVGVAIFVLSMFARLLKQRKLEDRNENNT